MKTRVPRIITHYLSVILLLSILLPARAYGQIWTDHNTHDPGIISLEWMVPSFDDFFDAEAPTSALLVYSRVLISENVSVLAELPISHFKTSRTILGDNSKTAAGNPYLGVLFDKRSTFFDFEFGLRIPLAPTVNVGLLTGQLIENRSLGRFESETTTISGLVRYQREWLTGLILRAAAGPDLFIQQDSDTDVNITYYGQLLYRVDALTIGGGFSGQTLLSEDFLSFGDRTLFDIGVLGSYRFGNLQAGTYLRIPMDDDVNDILNFIIGLQFGILLP